jgi:peptidoglycan/LPS O-acetylase OafA/YrhL
LNPNLSYRPDIDGLRAVAVLAVVLHHLSASLVPGGYVGVDVFFVISGYLITGIISREMAQGTFTFARFYERRARRIFPALFAVLTVTLVAGYFLLLPTDYSGTLRGALGTLFFASNIVFWRDMADGYFAATDAGLNPLLHTWSLAVEEQFYVFFPVLLLLCFRYGRRYLLLILMVCAAVSLAGAALLVQGKSVAVFFLSPFRVWELLAGSLLALGAVPPIRSRAVREVVADAGLLAILAACVFFDSRTTFPGLAALAPVLGAAALIHAGGSGHSLAGHLLQWRPMVYIGLISYSLYLWHWPLIVLTRYAMGMEPISPYIPSLFAASLVLGGLSYRFIEQPFRRGMRITRRFVFASSAVFVVLFGAWSVFGLMRGGSEDRFTLAIVQIDNARSPQIPFVSCDGRPASAACQLGRSESKPTVLFWGDSHLLAWAPALDASLNSHGEKGLFVTNSACPPLLGVLNSIKSFGFSCPAKNQDVKTYLLANPDIQTVVMAASWTMYFREDGPLTSQAGNPHVNGLDAATAALASTIQWLRNNGRQVIVIGPVPVYDKSVPLGLALEQAMGIKFKPTSMATQRQKNAAFFAVVENETRDVGNSVRLIDPIAWMCSAECIVMADGIPMYRDRSHLSVAGAMALELELRRGLYPPAPILAGIGHP